MMSDESQLRAAASGALLLNLCVAGYHRFKAHTGERISHQPEGWWTFAIIRLAGFVAAVGLIGGMFARNYFSWAALPIPMPIRWLGICLGYGSALLLYWTMSTLGKNLTDTVVTRENASLVTTGPYHFVRHPFYLCVGLLLGGFFLITQSAIVGIATIVLLAMLTRRTSNEEQHLLARFGDAYRDYQQRTGRFIPRWRRG